MKNSATSPKQNQKRFNQLFFNEREITTKAGRFTDVKDSYGNEMSRIDRIYNTAKYGKYEYTAYDHAGNQNG